ncbi:2-hydroxyglutaryl-CoA dehydratase [Anaerotruncus colihominis]|uniref:2-hydroxyglutaryl-CoA dehydratase n=1 Tax=Anaerotruncus colihominis TaxID=169435 RepID=A0A1Y4MJ30_9FIRM|nr:2-hydroxyacyl-CoA dehydratase [Anaerotruncus colihominis]OUP68190.1 2-hydroxyglutaryl-CoA dehydratase [Anaerotruncus colihominis]OUP72395.1 2-hydroxyglutaryl-CoA dehydratase [Anaerotruncus colihominis]
MPEQNDGRVLFTKEMKRDYTILVPTMLPIHFKLMINILREYGYKAELLENSGQNVVDSGLRNVHNDTCYPALLVIGQMIDALESGKYDLHKVALLITQTGGGCRASNYIHLLRKALMKSGYGYIPVVSLSANGMEKNPGFKLTPMMLDRVFYALNYGDLLMLLANQCRPYELEPGATDALVDKWANRLTGEMKGRGLLSYKRVRRNYDAIIRDFAALPREKTEKIRVGVVGEIYVKFSPLGNNNLEEFLLSEGAEVVVPGLLDFCLYCVYNQLNDHKLYGLMSAAKTFVLRMVYNMLVKKQRDVIDAVNAEGTFRPGGYFPHTVELVRGYISHGVKMGEGWLLTAEMLELIEQGAGNIVCTQPFGCLPNHIVGKGMMRVIKERNPQSNIVAVDYDPGATKINQENRIKLMLANAASIAEQAGAGKMVPMPQHENEYDSANTPVHNPFLNPTPTSSSRN